MGGTKVAFRAEPDGADAHESSFNWPESGRTADDITALHRHAEEIRARTGQPVAAVGVAVPATLDADGRVTSWPTRPFWRGLDLATVLGELFPRAELHWADDGDLAALAEAQASGRANLVYVGVGTGIGGGIVLGGRSVPGPRRGSCELGHLIVARQGERCDCGRRGCVQAEASGPATLRRASAARGARVSFAELRHGYAEGAGWAVAAVEHSCAALAAALVGVGELVRPDAMVIGGGFAAGLPGFVEETSRQAALLSRQGHPPAPIGPAVLGGKSSLHGAVLAARGGTGA
ncbi:ROK family protein [Streptomyces wedmorensis]|uniref:ROK family protein n=1 Tax=Streptomyces wedmorensis TaxID=43759 RepID=A0ABW6ITR0_STRWE